MDTQTASGQFVYVNETQCWYSVNGGAHQPITVAKTAVSTAMPNYGYYEQIELLSPGDVVQIGYPTPTVPLVIGENNPQSNGVVSVNNMSAVGTSLTYTASVITYTVH
jgi:hypothetical protein